MNYFEYKLQPVPCLEECFDCPPSCGEEGDFSCCPPAVEDGDFSAVQGLLGSVADMCNITRSVNDIVLKRPF